MFSYVSGRKMIKRVCLHNSKASNTASLNLQQERKGEEKSVKFVKRYNKTIMASGYTIEYNHLNAG